jgi:hypothetical protein
LLVNEHTYTIHSFFVFTHSTSSLIRTRRFSRVSPSRTPNSIHPFDSTSPPNSTPTSKMGQNLSSKISVDTSKDVLSPGDARGDKIMGLLWLLAIYGIAMIWSTTALVDRWRGPHGNSKIGFASVLAAILMSTAWPVVFVYLMVS